MGIEICSTASASFLNEDEYGIDDDAKCCYNCVNCIYVGWYACNVVKDSLSDVDGNSNDGLILLKPDSFYCSLYKEK